MPRYNILIGCDQKYYNDWGENLLKSIHVNCPQVNLHCHVVNQDRLIQLPYVNYTFETKTFQNEESKIAYMQAVRFLRAAKFDKNEYVVTLDADTICVRPFSLDEFAIVFDQQSVLKHHKADRWLAGFVAFRNDNFRTDFASLLNNVPVEEWTYGRDQSIMELLIPKYNFQPVDSRWMRIAKPKPDTVFLTLKGEQKTTEKYLIPFRGFIK